FGEQSKHTPNCSSRSDFLCSSLRALASYPSGPTLRGGLGQQTADYPNHEVLRPSRHTFIDESYQRKDRLQRRTLEPNGEELIGLSLTRLSSAGWASLARRLYIQAY